MLLNSLRRFVVGAEGRDEGKRHMGLLGPQTSSKLESCMCVSKMRDKLRVWD